MITARNYCAQAERGLIETVNGFKEKYRTDSTLVKFFCSRLKHSVHFALPDNGVLFDDNFKGISGKEIRLPFPEITIEYYVEKELDFDPSTPVYAPKRLILAAEMDAAMLEKMGFAKRQNQDEIAIAVFAANEVNGSWRPIVGGWILYSDWDVTTGTMPAKSLIEYPEDRAKFAGSFVALCPGIANDTIEQLGYDDAMMHMMHDISGEVAAVLALCEALSCSNVGTEIHQKADHAKNARRIKDGKTPIYETKILSLVMPGKAKKDSAGSCGDRNPVRQHLRRGHIRRLENKNVWVNSCVVGDKKHGVIVKDYQVQAAA